MNKFKIKLSRKFIIAIVSIIVILFALAGLTMAYYVKNYLGIGMLCPESGNQKIPQGLDASDLEIYSPSVALEPVIYLYPEKPSQVKVELHYAGELIADYPDYDYLINGWNVLAYPDGKIINDADNKEYSYIFWEGEPSTPIRYDLSTGFIVKGSETKIFLQNVLEKIGLTPKEYNEFIVYWYPKMKNNKYNLIKFAGKEYTDIASLTITPKPDSMLRVFMVYKQLNESIDIKPQEIKPFTRKGFTVVEWGGTEIK